MKPAWDAIFENQSHTNHFDAGGFDPSKFMKLFDFDILTRSYWNDSNCNVISVCVSILQWYIINQLGTNTQ